MAASTLSVEAAFRRDNFFAETSLTLASNDFATPSAASANIAKSSH